MGGKTVSMKQLNKTIQWRLIIIIFTITQFIFVLLEILFV